MMHYNLRILYIEDEVDTLEPLTVFLKRRFTKVITATNGKEALDKFFKYNPDIILTDLVIPDMGGIEFIEEVRKSGFQNPVIITSALSDAPSIIKTVDIGISKYIIKPIELMELEEALERFAESVLENTGNVLHLNGVEKKEIEKTIKFQFMNLIKKHSGKGPRDIVVFIGQEQLEIRCLNVQTVFEKTLLRSGRNASIVEQNRMIFYNILKQEIEELVSRHIGMKVKLKDIEVNPVADTDFLTLTYLTG